MKRLLLFGACLLVYAGTHAQGLVPKPIPCFEPFIYTNPATPGAYSIDRSFENYSCVDFDYTAYPGNYIGEGRTDAVAGKYLHFGPDTHFGSFASAPYVNEGGGDSLPPQFHAYIGTNDFDVVWFEPNSTPGTVGRYEKLELGVKLPTSLDDMVYKYVHHDTTGSWLNPFNPDSISVEAQFFFLGDQYSDLSYSTSTTIYGFYYRDFERHITDNDTLWDDGWIEDTTSYTFRIRYAPTLTGNWSVKIKIVTPSGVYEVLPIGFKCVESGNPGYMTVGTTNSRFFKLGENTFIPIGTDMPHPTCYGCLGPGIDAAELYGSTPMPSKGYTVYLDQMQDLHDNGGNYMRMFLTPAATDIEFEHIGNYSDRMNRAWEVDKILEKAHDIDLYIHFNMEIHYVLENPTFYGMWYWDWMSNDLETIDPGHVAYGDSLAWVYDVPDPGYCYHSELGLSNPIEFFSNTDAVKFYKRKVRYMISRWGYSTNIALWELYSETDNAGSVPTKTIDTTKWVNGGHPFSNSSTYHPYWTLDTDTVPPLVESWNSQIASYIKNDLQHHQHLISAEYTGGPGTGERINNIERSTSYPTLKGPDAILDQTYSDDNIDVNCWSQYAGANVNRFNGLAQRSIPDRNIGKPIMYAETGSDLETSGLKTQNCDNNAEFVKSLWSTTFTGTAGPGLDWNSYSYDLHDTWQYYGILKNFLSDYSFADGDWEPAYDERNDGEAEFFALMNYGTKNEAVGVIVNKTYNAYTQSALGSPCRSLSNSDIGGSNYETPVNPSPSLSHALKFNLFHEGDYIIYYYDALTGRFIRSSAATVLPLVNDLYLEYPTLCIDACTDDDGDGYVNFYPIVGFKVVEAVEERMSSMTNDSTFNPNNLMGLKVRPNPASNNVVIDLPPLQHNSLVKILNSSGQEVFSSNALSQQLTVDVSAFGSGIYLVYLKNGTQIRTKKLIIQHEKD